jgi:hypothetical protein
MIEFPRGLEPVEDLSPAAWVQEALKDWPSGRSFLVRDLVPPVYEAYARILHRAHRPEDRGQPTGTWSERATQLGRPLGSETTWHDLTGTKVVDGPARDAWMPTEGGWSEEEVRVVVTLLSDLTATPLGCWFAMWSGWGEISGGTSSLSPLDRPTNGLRLRWRVRPKPSRARSQAARFKTFALLGGGRSYLLIKGAVDDASLFDLGYGFRSPALWWPEDRAWFVHTEIDALSTYLGGSQALIDRLVREQVLESFEVDADSRAAL